MPVPASNISELVDRMDKISRDKSQQNEFTLKMYERDANQHLRTGEIAVGNLLLGMLSCIRGDIEATHKYHKIANKQSEDLEIAIQYCVSMVKLKCFEDGYKIAEDLYLKYPPNSVSKKEYMKLLNHMTNFSAKLGYEDEFKKYKAEFATFTGVRHGLDIDFPEDDDTTLSVMFDTFDDMVENNSDLVVELDKDLLNTIDNLVAGVNID